MGVQDQGPVPQPQRLLCLHGRLLHLHRSRHLHHDACVQVHLQEVRMGNRRAHHPRGALHHRNCLFSLVLFSDALTPSIAALGMTPLMAAVLVGAAQNIFSKSSKYSLFDPCKEMAYIPLDAETKVKGKAAIDVVCNPLGKSGGALIQQFMILTFGSLAASTPYLAIVLFAIVGLWIRSSLSLNSQFVKKEKEMLLAAAAESDVAEGETVKVKSKVGEDGFVEGEVIKVTKDVAMSSVEE